MIILQNITDSLQFKLNGSVATNQLPFVCHYVDSTSTTYSPLRTTGLSNDATAVTLASSPGASTTRTIKTLSIQNKDTASAIVSVLFNDNGTLYNIIVATLSSGDNLEYTESNGWKVLSSTGEIKTGTASPMVYPGAGIPISTGSAWTTSITDNSSNWNTAASWVSTNGANAVTAYGWGNHASAGYLTGITSGDVTTALGYTPVTNARTLTINGTTYDLTADRSWTISGSGVSALSAIGSTPNANSATITGSTLNLEPASVSFGGVVTTGTQTFAGRKIFNGYITIAGGTASAGTSPLKFTSGTNLTTPEAGAMEYDGTSLYFSPSTTRRTVVLDTATQTLTNKRINPRVQAVTSASTVTPSADNDDEVVITAQGAALTLANWSGTPVQGQAIIIRIKDDSTARAITFDTLYRAVGAYLPTTTVIGKTVYIACIYNSTDTKIDVVSVAQEI